MGVLESRHALVTGGASGIGLATSRRMAAEGARVAIVDLDEQGGKAAAQELGGIFVKADVSDSAQVAAAFKQAEDFLRKIDIAYLNAGVTTGEQDIASVSDEAYRRIAGINIDGVLFGVREAVRVMRRTGGGSVVSTASLSGINAYPPDPVYAATKHAVVGLTRALGPLLESDGITINCICPGIVDTPLLREGGQVLREMGFPLIAPEQVAEAVVRAITDGTTGGAWVVQPGREPIRYEFKGVPGPGGEWKGMTPPGVPR